MLFLRNVLRSFALTNPLRFIILPALICFFALILYRLDGPLFRKSTVIPAAFGSLFTIIGYSFATQENWDLVVTSFPGQWLKVIFAFVGYATLFLFLAAFLFEVTEFFAAGIADSRLIPPRPERAHPLMERWNASFKAHPFRNTFLLLLIGCIPAAIASYPGLFMGDTPTQIIQAFADLPVMPTYLTGHLISETVHINAHHPVLHTLLLHAFVLVGLKLFHLAGAGLFILGVLQTLLLITALSAGICVLVRHSRISGVGIALMLAFWIFLPISQTYFFLMTKDVLYTVVFLFFLICLFQIQKGMADKKYKIGLGLSAVGMILFRNEGKYILAAALVVVLLISLKKPRRLELARVALGGLAVTVLGAAILSAVLSAGSVTPGSRREMLSVPFQQTARYLRDHGEDVTEEELQTINAVLDADRIRTVYDPNSSDPVKYSFNEDAASDQISAYLRVWWNMFLRHPGCYIQATIGNYYEYVYPDAGPMNMTSYSWSVRRMEEINRPLEPHGVSLSYPQQLDAFRQVYETVKYSGDWLPLISMFMKPAVYVWLAAFLLLCSLRYRSRNVLTLIAVPVFMILVCFLGPCNGTYGRYLYPLIMAAPLLVCMTLSLLAGKRQAEKAAAEAAVRDGEEDAEREEAERKEPNG